jgi:uncharacterized hydrophobic protein (TIGR00271 family)
VLRENLFTAEGVPGFEQKLFYEGKRRRPYLEQFGVLLTLAAIIASAGILSDSTATVIGAMIVAPLMTPIMATAAALVTGRMDRAGTSLGLVLVGVAAVIGLSWLTGILYSGALSFETNSQITGRISPRAMDLVAALASGAAGAFCMSRDDVADSIAGVAIAISLVPPLCVVGISLSYGEIAAAQGALLLFITNTLAILLAGGGLLAALGLPRAAGVMAPGRARRTAFFLIGVAVIIVLVPLTITGRQLARDVREEAHARAAAETWLAGTDFRVRSAQVTGDRVAFVISGSGEPPPFATLVSTVERGAGRPMVVELEVVPSSRLQAGGTLGGRRG